jgi:hypothetical protein
MDIGNLIVMYEIAGIHHSKTLQRYLRIRDEVMSERGIIVSDLGEKLVFIIPEIIGRIREEYPIDNKNEIKI